MTQAIDLDAMGQAEAVRAGDVTATELVSAALARIDSLNGRLNAVIHRMDDKALGVAAAPVDGPFSGVPMVLKDLTAHSAGDPFHEGMRMLRDVAWTEAEDTYLVAKLRAAGFVFVGRTNVPEFGLVPTTEPAAYGPTCNPWDTTRSTGGSSGGSAAAVASGMVAVGHANDGGGSIRIPASECGLYGLKPSRGRVSLGPEYGQVWEGFEAEHVVTRSVRDCAALLDVVAGPMPGDPYVAPPPSRPFLDAVTLETGRLRVGVLCGDPSGTVEVQPQCAAAARAAGDLLAELGHNVSDASPPALADPSFTPNFITVYTVFADWCLEDTRRRTGQAVDRSGCEPSTWALAEMGRAVTPAHYVQAMQALHLYSRGVRSWWEPDGFDLLVTPTIPEPPPVLGQFASTEEDPLAPLFRAAAIVPFTAPFNVTGQPAASVPLHWDADGLPIGVQLVGAYGREDLLLSVSAQLEQARPWAGRRPPIWG
ncbi:MAG TPA: amidase [Acidimicrobiales bacterium]|nr:amidase [Acidimicrobiales bacterium]